MDAGYAATCRAIEARPWGERQRNAHDARGPAQSVEDLTERRAADKAAADLQMTVRGNADRLSSPWTVAIERRICG